MFIADTLMLLLLLAATVEYLRCCRRADSASYAAGVFRHAMIYGWRLIFSLVIFDYCRYAHAASPMFRYFGFSLMSLRFRRHALR